MRKQSFFRNHLKIVNNYEGVRNSALFFVHNNMSENIDALAGHGINAERKGLYNDIENHSSQLLTKLTVLGIILMKCTYVKNA